MRFLLTGFPFTPAGNVAKSSVMIVVKATEPYVLILTVALPTILIMTRFMRKIDLVSRLFGAAALGLCSTTGVCHAASQVVGWGRNGNGQAVIPSGLSNVVTITAGGFDNLALTGDATPAITVQPASQSVIAVVTVPSIRIANNSLVVWVVQINCVISGTVDVSGQNANGAKGGLRREGIW